MEDREVVRLCDRMWGRRQARNLACDRAGGDATWAEVIAVAEEIYLSVLTLHLTSPIQGKRAEIERRCALDGVARRASIYPTAYARPLYVSDGFMALVAAEDDARCARGDGRRKLDVPKHCREHVVPVTVHASGQKILERPEDNLPRIRRTFLAPICLITTHEDDAVRTSNVKGHASPNRPFSRYEGIATVRRTDTGEAIDPRGFTFRDHLAVMRLHPAYASGVPLLAGGARTWRERIRTIREKGR